MFCHVAILCLVATAVLSAPTDVVPLENQQPTVVPIISQSEELEPNGTYKFSYETGNGIKHEETSFDKVIPKVRGHSDSSGEGSGSDESDEIHVQRGSYSYTAPDGTVITVRYIADENGFQAFGDHLPRAPQLLQISSNSAEKSGRALKSIDSAETASAPVPDMKLKSVPKPESSEPESAPPVAQISGHVESKSTEVSATPDQSTPAEASVQSSTTVASKSTTQTAEQSSTTANAETDPSTTVIAEQSATTAEQSTSVTKQSTIAAEQSTIAAEQSSTAATAEESSTSSTDQATANIEETASTANSENNAASEDSSTPASAAAKPEPVEQSTSIPESEQPASTTAAL